MASSCIKRGRKLKMLDPGCGTGILTAALAEHLSRFKELEVIELVAFENDEAILPLAESSLNYLSGWLNDRKINFTFFLCKNDFILHNSQLLIDGNINTENYDIVISNPPYFKLPKK